MKTTPAKPLQINLYAQDWVRAIVVASDPAAVVLQLAMAVIKAHEQAMEPCRKAEFRDAFLAGCKSGEKVTRSEIVLGADALNAIRAAPNIRVDVPQQAAPVVSVNVSPTPVTIENEVIVPQRTVIAKPGRNGEIIMTPQE